METVDKREAFYHAARIPYLLGFMIGGNVGLPLILLATWLSLKVIRHPVFTNWFITGIIFSTVYLLLFYVGEFDNELPPSWLCRVQAVMIYSADAMLGLSSMFIVIYMERVVNKGLTSETSTSQSVLGRKLTFFFIVTPYSAFYLVYVIMVSAITGNRDAVHRSHFYCTISLSVKHLASGVAAICGGVSVILLVIILVRLYLYRRRNGQAANVLPRGTGIDLSLIFRISLLAILTFLSVIVSMASILHVTGPVPNLLLSFFPFIMALTCGTSSDLRRAYFACGRSSQTDEEAGIPAGSKVSVQVSKE